MREFTRRQLLALAASSLGDMRAAHAAADARGDSNASAGVNENAGGNANADSRAHADVARVDSDAHANAASVLGVREVAVPRPGRFGHKCLLLRPARVPESVALPLLVLFHGLGESGSEALGIHAWHDRYGLPQAYARLCAPPVARTLPRVDYLSDDRLAAINRELARAPFEDVCLVCPFTPNVLGKNPSAPVLDRYAEYLEQALLPAVRAATATLLGREHLGVDGVSLGGYVSLEVFSRRPALFGTLGSLQGAFSLQLADVYAQRIAHAGATLGPTRVHIATSTRDPFRSAAERLIQRLDERGAPATFTLATGPHDQVFLREAGALELLLFQGRALNDAGAAAASKR